jgi:hypothetical protein
MDFVTAEEKFNELQARIRRGEPMSEDQYQEELAKLMVQDDTGVFWSLEPGTGRWLYFNGTEWVPGMPPPPSAPPVVAAPVVETPSTYQPYASQAPAYQEPAPEAVEPVQDSTSYYVPSDVTRPVDYQGGYNQGGYNQGGYNQGAYNQTTYTGTPSYEDNTAGSAYVPLSSTGQPMDADSMPTYVRMPEPDPTVGAGGIPPRPVREASPLAVPGGERAWLPFAFGALVLLLCAVVLFFGVRGLPQFSGATVQDPTEEPTEEVDVLPTETAEIEPTEMPQPTVQPTPEPPPTPVPQPVTAAATDVLNIRQGPDRTTPSLGKLQPQQSVTVIGRNGDGTWLQIVRPDGGGNGWVSAEFVTLTGDINTLPVVSGDGGGAAPVPTETPTG